MSAENTSTPDTPKANDAIMSLAELSQKLKKTVEGAYERVRVKAEIAQPKRAASGHIYFTLKDATATLDAVCWRGQASQLTQPPIDGLEVVVTGRLTIFAGRSKYQIIVDDIELEGEGALLKAIEDRKKRLAAEGLFDEARKKPIPRLPQTIGVITSPTGAVLHDILHRLQERLPVRVLLWPVAVQGASAAEEIATAIRGFDALNSQKIPRPDVLILARGGGALEDLMAFNEEAVVRAVAACSLPIITGVGHETDTTLVDFAGDYRSPTPTAAAEFATAITVADIQAQINTADTTLIGRMHYHIETHSQNLRHLTRSLTSPKMLLENKNQQLDIMTAELNQRMAALLVGWHNRLMRVGERLTPPSVQLAQRQGRIDLAGTKLASLMGITLERYLTRLDKAIVVLEASSFMRILERGFALIRTPDGAVMRSHKTHSDGTRVELYFADGVRMARLGKGENTPKKSSPKPLPNPPLQGGLF